MNSRGAEGMAMKRFKSILVTVTVTSEGGAGLLARAADLAVANGARLTVVDVAERLPAKFTTAMAREELQSALVASRTAELEALVEPIRGKLKPGVKVLVGIPFVEIIREVLRERHDLVMRVPEHRRAAPLFGSTDMHLMRKCPCAVWMIKPMRRKRFTRILAAVDPDPSESVKQGLNAKILELASSLAQREEGELHLVYAWAFYGESVLIGPRVGMSREEVDRWVMETEAEQRKELAELTEQHVPAGLRPRLHLVRGEARDVIPHVAAKNKVDLIVMGTVARTGIPGFFIGNTAEAVLQHVRCSVLTVKPKGFATPVKLE